MSTALTPAERFAALADTFADTAGFTAPSPGKGFGATELKIHNKIFATLSKSGRLAVKLPVSRVDALIAQQAGQPYMLGQKRMKEWVILESTSPDDWHALAREAMEFVTSKR